MADIISKIIPILLLIAVGYFMQYKKIVKQSTIDEMKKIIVNISLPSVLFIAFLDMELKSEYLLVTAVVISMHFVFYLVGVSVNRIKGIAHPLTPFLTTGCSFGLLGIPLYGIVFGIENIGIISILGVGHELFIWFIFINLLKMRLSGERFTQDSVKSFFKSPLIISIVSGILFNLTGINLYIFQQPVLKGMYSTIQSLGSIATPLILLIIGYGLKLDKKYFKQSIRFLLVRYLVIFTVGYLFKFAFIDRIIEPQPLFNYAYFTFLSLPTLLSLPIFVGKYSTKEHEELANNTVVVSTIIGIIIFIIFSIMVSL